MTWSECLLLTFAGETEPLGRFGEVIGVPSVAHSTIFIWWLFVSSLAFGSSGEL